VPIDRVGRVMVNDDLTIPGHPEVQVIGDLANFSHQTGQPLPGVSPVAMQQGRLAARNILAMIDGQSRSDFAIGTKAAWRQLDGTKPLPTSNSSILAAFRRGWLGYSCTSSSWSVSGIGCSCYFSGHGPISHSMRARA
jgi:NADH dehydrogenase, FAD-containing subunit